MIFSFFWQIISKPTNMIDRNFTIIICNFITISINANHNFWTASINSIAITIYLNLTLAASNIDGIAIPA